MVSAFQWIPFTDGLRDRKSVYSFGKAGGGGGAGGLGGGGGGMSFTVSTGGGGGGGGGAFFFVCADAAIETARAANKKTFFINLV